MRNYTKRFEYKSASCLLKVDHEQAKLSHVFASTRGHGHATQLLAQVMDYVDYENLEVTLKAQAYGHPVQTILTNSELVRFYEKFGFKKTHDYGCGAITDMIRPKKLRRNDEG